MFGFHIKKEKRDTMLEAIEEDITNYSITSAQIFVLNPRSSKTINLGNLGEIKKYIEENKIKLYVHSSYTTVSIWNDNPRGLELLINQLVLCKQIGARGLVVHLPKKHYLDVVGILKKYKAKINKTDAKLLLEHPTYKSDNNCSYEMPFQLNRLTTHLNKIGLKKWGYTIDTAHLWSSITEDDRDEGFTVETYKGANKWLSALDKKTRNKIKLIHLNGSHNLHSSNKDKHAIFIYGTNGKEKDNMWGSLAKLNPNKAQSILLIKKTGLYRFIRFARAKKISSIIEMNAGTFDQLSKSLDVMEQLL